MRKIVLGLLSIIILVSCSKNSDEFEGLWLLEKSSSKSILVKIVKVENNLYEFDAAGEIGFGIKENDTIYCTTPRSRVSIDNLYFNEKKELIFDGDTMKKFDYNTANQILEDKKIKKMKAEPAESID
jgi:hypothetical protein